MLKSMSLAILGAAMVVGAGAVSGTALAQTVPVTNVSSRGVDSGTCSPSSPCRTFAYAFTQTLDAGVISVLDPANYGSVTITRSITILGNDLAGRIVVPANGFGIRISSSSAVVTLKGLVIDGTNASGTTGIQSFNYASLVVDSCLIQGLNQGVVLGYSGHHSDASITGNIVVHNQLGVYGLDQAMTDAVLGGNTISQNKTGVMGNFYTYGDNGFSQNTADSSNANIVVRSKK